LRFSRLKLNGFKSFVDPTDLVIADGLTGVVGPNGCGKSNLLEALRWVMGETRPKAMRGGGMEDVIFAGAATRNARNFAEVTIQIDNGDRLAPAGFNDSDQIEIVRRITRDAGSAFKVNTKDARARDVQMLFADASTGAHSPALVRQGQISELINAKPKNRRRVLEEAAGISGLYARRHEAELKLNGAETNLQRVDDVLEQLAAQLTQLARQARQAARYREIGEALRQAEGMLLYRRWREADSARANADAELRERIQATGLAERAAIAATKARTEQEEALPPLREEETIAAAILQRVTVERDTLAEQEKRARAEIEALEARIAQLTKDLEREDALNQDAAQTIERLSQEATELQAAGEGHDDALAAAAQAARETTKVLDQQEHQLSDLTEEAARLSARHQSAQRLLADTKRTKDRSEAEAEKAKASLAHAETGLADAQTRLALSETAQATAQRHADEAEALLAEADEARADAQAREAQARAERSEADGVVAALSAEVNALARLLERETSEDGQLLDQLRVSPGYEKALGAALADDLRAPAVAATQSSGWVTLPGYPKPQMLPDGVTGLANHVTGPDVLARRLAQIGLVDATEGAELQLLLQPGQRLVSREGDLWRWDGFRAGAEDAPSAAALRLQQLNRLEELKQELEQANARVEGASRAHDVLRRQLDEITQADKRAREARRAADAKLTESSRAQSKAEADRNIAEGRVESLRMAVTRHEDEATQARAALREAEAAQQGLGDLDQARAAVEQVKLTVEAARMTMMSRRAAADELKHAGEARSKRLAQVTKELETWRNRLENADKRIAEVSGRKHDAEGRLSAAADEPDRIAQEGEKLTGAIKDTETRRTAAATAVTAAETALREATIAERDSERTAGEAREARAAAEARAEAALAAQRAATEQIAEAQEMSPEGLLGTLKTDPDQMPSSDRIEADVNRLKRQRDALGAVNLRAEEDAKSVQEEHDQLVNEKADLEAAITKLRSGIGALNREGRERLLTAFEQVNSNFSMLFKHLFGGGEANLVLVESEDPLEAGLEIMCQPPGKKLSTLSLLSGGEQTLTALALIFAVFLANPAPICVLDEVDAPLDDANVTRFCDLLDEMTRRTETRFLIITHHAVTMARMDRLFGVTMQEQGVSQLVSVDLKKAEQMVA
jgi:chromosome segregation protein